MFWADHIIFLTALILLVGISAAIFSSRVGAPLLLAFIAVGMLFGEEGPGGIVFNDMKVAYLIGSLSLAIILFDGGMHTTFHDFRHVIKPSFALASLGVLVTAGITGLGAMLLLHIPLTQGLLLGSILASTDAAAVFILLSNSGVNLSKKLLSTLEVESGINDPMAVFLTLTLVGLLSSNTPAPTWWECLASFFWQMGSGAVAGYYGGKLLLHIGNRLPKAFGLTPVLALAGGLFLYSGMVLLHGSGFLAVYLAGLVIGNGKIHDQTIIPRFHDGLAWLCQIILFTMIGLLVTPSMLISQIVPALIIAFILLFLARPAGSWISLSPFDFTWREKNFVSWVGLRGAVPIFLATIPSLSGLDSGRTYFDITFVVVVSSLLIQGWTVAAVARWLKL
ncbi:MAG TPA: potassium/proton antiporter [Rickettsiales bacterium]|nr:potassium/proton antiporter [Rickettsiales bacterium]